MESVYIGDNKCPGIYTISENKIGEISKYGDIYQACCGTDCSYIAKWQSEKKSALEEAKIQYFVAQHGIAPMIREVLICENNGAIIIMDVLSITAGRMIRSLSSNQLTVTIQHYRTLLSKVLDNIKKYDIDTQKIEEKLYSPTLTFEELHNLRGSINKKCWETDGNVPTIDSIDIQVADTDEQKNMRIHIVQQIVYLIIQLHKLGIAHLDTHLNNFMKGDGDRYYIIDFGLSTESPTQEQLKYDYNRYVRDIKKFSTEDGYVNLDYLLDYAYMLNNQAINKND